MWLCDEYNDCSDGSDESGCHRCAASQFQCGDGTCIPQHKRCDSVIQCEDYSDEVVSYCVKSSVHPAPGGRSVFCIPLFKCWDLDLKMIQNQTQEKVNELVEEDFQNEDYEMVDNER